MCALINVNSLIGYLQKGSGWEGTTINYIVLANKDTSTQNAQQYLDG